MPPKPARDLPAQRLAHTYATAWDRIEFELDTIKENPLAWRRRKRLTELESLVGDLADELDGSARAWLQNELPQVYAAGAAEMGNAIQNAQQHTQALQAGLAVGSGESFAWTLVHREALQEVATNTFDNLLQSTKLMKVTTKEFIRSIVHEETLQKLTTGATAQQAGRKIIERLIAEHGIAGVIYKDGARHTIADYGEMVARTQTALAYNRGAIEQCKQDGVFFVEVFDGPKCGWTSHDDIDPASGSIRTVEEAAVFSIAHPRCLRSFGPRPDIKSGGGGPVSNILAAEAKAAGLPTFPTAPGNTHAATIEAQSAQVKHALPPGTPAQTAKKITQLGLDPHIENTVAEHGPVKKIVKGEGGSTYRLYFNDGAKQVWHQTPGGQWFGSEPVAGKVAKVKAVKQEPVAGPPLPSAPVAGPPLPTSGKFESTPTQIIVGGQHLQTPKQTAKKLNDAGAPPEAKDGAKKVVTLAAPGPTSTQRYKVYYWDGTVQTWWESATQPGQWLSTEKVLSTKAAKAQKSKPTPEPAPAPIPAQPPTSLPSAAPPEPTIPVTPTQTGKKLDKMMKQGGLAPSLAIGATKITMNDAALSWMKNGNKVGTIDVPVATIHYPGAKLKLKFSQASQAWIPIEGGGKSWAELHPSVAPPAHLAPPPVAPPPPPEPPGLVPPQPPKQTGKKLEKLANLADTLQQSGVVPPGAGLDPDLLLGVTKITMNDAAKEFLVTGHVPDTGIALFKLDYAKVPGVFSKPTVKLGVKKSSIGATEFVHGGTSWKEWATKVAEKAGTAAPAGAGSLASLGFKPTVHEPVSVPTIQVGAKLPKPKGFGTPIVIDEAATPVVTKQGPPPAGSVVGSTPRTLRDNELVNQLRVPSVNGPQVSSARAAWLVDGTTVENASKVMLLLPDNSFVMYERRLAGDPHWTPAAAKPTSEFIAQSFMESVGLKPTGAETGYLFRPGDGSAAKPHDGVIVTYENNTQRLWLNKGSKEVPRWEMQTGVLGAAREEPPAVKSNQGRRIIQADPAALPRGVELPERLPEVWGHKEIPPTQSWDMPESSRQSISKYTTPYYRTVNGALRGESNMTPTIERHVRNMEDGIKRAPPPPESQVVRGVYLTNMGITGGAPAAKAYVEDNFPIGAVVEMPGMVSTSYSLERGISFSDHLIFEIQVDPEQSAYIKGYSSYPMEAEVLLSSQSKFVVTEIVEDQTVESATYRNNDLSHKRVIVRLQQMPVGWVDERQPFA